MKCSKTIVKAIIITASVAMLAVPAFTSNGRGPGDGTGNGPGDGTSTCVNV